jgi:hypothetical protein
MLISLNIFRLSHSILVNCRLFLLALELLEKASTSMLGMSVAWGLIIRENGGTSI